MLFIFNVIHSVRYSGSVFFDHSSLLHLQIIHIVRMASGSVQVMRRNASAVKDFVMAVRIAQMEMMNPMQLNVHLSNVEVSRVSSKHVKASIFLIH